MRKVGANPPEGFAVLDMFKGSFNSGWRGEPGARKGTRPEGSWHPVTG